MSWREGQPQRDRGCALFPRRRRRSSGHRGPGWTARSGNQSSHYAARGRTAYPARRPTSLFTAPGRFHGAQIRRISGFPSQDFEWKNQQTGIGYAGGCTRVKTHLKFSAEVLKIDASKVAEQIEAGIREGVCRQLKRKGVVLGLSGGIDSSMAAALFLRPLGPEPVLGVFMPEAESSPATTRFAPPL